MKLFFNMASPFVRKVRVCAREMGLDKNIEEITTAVSPVQQNAALAPANPLLKIPTLVLDDGSALFDSPVICEYLDSQHSGPKLFPLAGPARWNALKLQATGDGILDAGILCRYEQVIRPKEFQWADWMAGQNNKWHSALDLLEREANALDGKPTIGSVAVGCALGWLDFRYADDGWRTNRSQLARWYEKFSRARFDADDDASRVNISTMCQFHRSHRQMRMRRQLMTFRGACALISAIILAAASALTCAQGYPVKPVRIISPSPPGGGNDTLSRAIAQKLTGQLGQPVVVDNRPGANTVIGTELLAKSPPDGYTIILVPSSHAINQSLYVKLPYDAVRDFAPITLAGSSPLLLAVHPSLPVKSVRELIRLAVSKPTELTFSTAGNGSSGHLAGVLFAITAGIKLQHVPYKGAAPAVTALLGGEVTMSVVPTLSLLPIVRAGKLRALGVTSAQRSPAAPDIPTIAESGMPGYVASLWYGFLAPANTPREIVRRLNTAIGNVLRDSEVRDNLSSQGIDPQSSTPEDFARLIATDLEKWAKVVKESGARID